MGGANGKGNSCRPEMNDVCTNALNKFTSTSGSLPQGDLTDNISSLCTSTNTDDQIKCFHAFNYVFLNYNKVNSMLDASAKVKELASGTVKTGRMLESQENQMLYRILRVEDTNLSSTFSTSSVKSSLEAVSVIDGATPTSMPSTTAALNEMLGTQTVIKKTGASNFFVNFFALLVLAILF